jgi:hypothetical protein
MALGALNKKFDSVILIIIFQNMHKKRTTVGYIS